MGGRKLTIFLVDGTTTGLRTGELGLSTCKVVMAPRVALETLGRRPEAKRTGVYVLVGNDQKYPGRLALYVGEGDDVFIRIKKHDGDESRDFWDHVLLFVSKDENLTKAHVRYLEARLIGLARDARRATLMNGTAPDAGGLPEADQAEMEEFLEHVRMLAAALGVGVFEAAPAESPATVADEPEIRLTIEGKGYQARAVLRQGQLVVLRGSIARTEEAPSLSPSSRALREELVDAGVLERTPAGLRFLQDYAFDSPSGAAQAINAANVNGRIAWRLADGRTLKDWQEAQLDTVEP